MLTISIAILISASLAVLFLLFLIYSWDFFTTLKAPFIPIPRKIIPKIIEALNVKDDSLVYDLGCGDGKVLIECCRDEPRAKYIGIDKSLIAIIMAKINLMINKNLSKNIKIRRGDIFQENLKTATCIYLYLYPKVLDELLPKLEKELTPGTRVISCSFAFKNKTPKQTINLGANNRFAKKLFVYQF